MESIRGNSSPTDSHPLPGEKPTLEDLIGSCPGMDRDLILEHLGRLEERYYQSFSLDDVCRHIEGISRLTPENPVRLLLEEEGKDRIGCTILALTIPSSSP